MGERQIQRLEEEDLPEFYKTLLQVVAEDRKDASALTIRMREVLQFYDNLLDSLEAGLEGTPAVNRTTAHRRRAQQNVAGTAQRPVHGQDIFRRHSRELSALRMLSILEYLDQHGTCAVSELVKFAEDSELADSRGAVTTQLWRIRQLDLVETRGSGVTITDAGRQYLAMQKHRLLELAQWRRSLNGRDGP